MEQFKASDDDWRKIERSAENPAADYSRAVCELRDRVAALEAKRVAPVQVPPTTVPTPPPLSPSADSLWEARLHVYRQGLAAGYEQGLAAGRAEQQATTEPATKSEPEPGDFQTLHGIALDMVDSLRPIVIPEILNVLRRAIREPMAEQQAMCKPALQVADDLTPEPEPSPSPAADGGLEDVIAGIIGNEPIIGRPCPAAGAVILAVAKWLRSMGNFSAATNLEREANR